MRLSLDALAVLDAIDRKGSFAAAAEALYRVPSAITYTVQKLEQDLDVELFDRSGHRARLTPAGETLLREGRHLLHAAQALERTVKRAASGWESEFTIAVNDVIPIDDVFPLVRQFYANGHDTHLTLRAETLNGVWDTLVSGQADLAIGVIGEGPPGGGYSIRPLGIVPFVFVVPPGHPLADVQEPLEDETIRAHRAIAARDTTRELPPMTSSLLGGQPVLTVSGLDTKLRAHRAGLGVGYLPRHMVADDLANGRLIERQVKGHVPSPMLALAWRTQHEGSALQWFLEALDRQSATLFADLLQPA